MEIDRCLRKIDEREKDIKYEESQLLRQQIEEEFREFHIQKRSKISGDEDISQFSGIEFETHVANLLRSRGYDVAGTPATGDQGADLIAKKDGKTIVVQAKRYQGTVGNKAVQEAIGAVQYYGADEGWMVTNSTFTPSAKALAQKSNVRLIDSAALQDGLR